jgi:hypothetical protein
MRNTKNHSNLNLLKPNSDLTEKTIDWNSGGVFSHQNSASLLSLSFIYLDLLCTVVVAVDATNHNIAFKPILKATGVRT